MRQLIIAGLAGLTFGAAAAPHAAEAIAFPFVLWHNYCWGAPTCALPPPAINDFTLYSNRTFTTGEGYSGTWATHRPTRQIRLTYDTGTVYQGRYIGNLCFEGEMSIAGGGLAGTWAGCHY